MAVIQSGDSGSLLKVNGSGQGLVTTSARVRSGVYIAHSGLTSLTAAADAATGGKLWLVNPATSSRIIAVRRMEVDTMGVAVATAITRLTVERITFTGTPSGAQILAAKKDSTFPAPSAYFTASSSGMSVSPAGVMYGFLCMSIITAVGVSEPVLGEWEPEEDAMPVLRPGEGMVVRQADAGAASDPRRATVNLAWEEF